MDFHLLKDLEMIYLKEIFFPFICNKIFDWLGDFWFKGNKIEFDLIKRLIFNHLLENLELWFISSKDFIWFVQVSKLFHVERCQVKCSTICETSCLNIVS